MIAEADRLLASQGPVIEEVARAAYQRLVEVLPDPVVTVDEQNVGLGVAGGYRGLVFTISPHREHVTIGIAGGADLPDPAGLMEGTGKVHRHVKLREVAALDRPGLTELLREAARRKR